MIYPDSFEQKIGFDTVRNLLKNFCVSSSGQLIVDEIKFTTSLTQIRHDLDETRQLLLILEETGTFPIAAFDDCTGIFKKAILPGNYIELEDLVLLRNNYHLTSQIYSFIQAKAGTDTPLTDLLSTAVIHKYVTERIDRVMNKSGEIKDNASRELADIRISMAAKVRQANQKLGKIFQLVKSSGWLDESLSPTIVNGRITVPVNSTYKRKISGLIHDESATGKTVYIEPAEVVEINNELIELEYAERREIRKILIELTDDLKPYAEDILGAFHFLAYTDFLNAKCKLCKKIKAVFPEIAEEPAITWNKARNPVLEINLSKSGRKVVPQTMVLDETRRILLISGPNAGGKSVCLKTAGLLQYMLQCGLPVPMEEDSKAGIFHKIFIDIGDEQSIENDLSTYSSHLQNWKYFLKNADARTLILIDEFGSGTEPQMGAAIAESLLEEFNNRKVFGLITTHYSNLKVFASNAEGIDNGAMLFDNRNMEPLYQLEQGRPGSSYAFEIATKSGIPEEILRKAAEKAGQDYLDVEKYIREAIRDKRYWQNKRDKIKEKEKKIEKLLEKYLNEYSDFEKRKKAELKDAASEADKILANANREIEKTIRTIKESQAGKEATLEARNKLQEFHQEVKSQQAPVSEKAKEIEKEYVRFTGKAPQKEEKITIQKDEIHIGDTVQMNDGSMSGEVMDIMKDSYLVAFGNMITTVSFKKVKKISKSEAKKNYRQQGTGENFATQLYNRKVNFRSNIDVRGKRGEEALSEIEKYIDEAIIVGSREVKILHGTGWGILKKLIREYLKTVDEVEWFGDEKIDQGGPGITVVKFR